MSLQDFRMPALLEKQQAEAEELQEKEEVEDVESKKGKGRRIKSKTKKV